MATLLLVGGAAVPAGAVAYLGSRLGSAVLVWAAVPIGLLTGGWLAIRLGRLAWRRLTVDGPDLLGAMRSGRRAPAVPDPRRSIPAGGTFPRRTQALVMFLWIACWVPLFPQGLIPLWMILHGEGVGRPLWFVALHVPGAWRAPTAAGFALLGLGMLGAAVALPIHQDRRQRVSC